MSPCFRSVCFAIIALAPPLALPVTARAQVSVPAPANKTPLPPPPARTLRFGALTPELLAEDPRLSQQKVKMVEARVYLSDALERWGKETGIRLEARDDASDSSGRWRVFVGLRDPVPLGRAMDALRSVLSQQGELWQWRRTGKATDYAYRLVCPATLEQHQEALRQEVQDDFEEQLEIAKRALTMTPEEMKRNAKSDRTGMLDFMAAHQSLREGVAAFASNVSSEQQQALMRGQTGELTLPFSALDEAGKLFAMNRAQESNRLNPGRELTPEGETPTRVIIKRFQPKSETIPSLMILVGDGRSAGGGSYIGTPTMENRRRDSLARGILLKSDAKKSAAHASAMEETITPDSAAGSAPVTGAKLLGLRSQEHALLQLAEAEAPRLNFMACLAQSFDSPGTGGAYGQTLSGFLGQLYQASVANKWQHDILLLRYTAGFAAHDGVANVPSQPLWEFATSRLDDWVKQRTVPMSDLLALSRMGNGAQWENLHSQIGTPADFLKQLSGNHPLIAMTASQGSEARVALLSPEGARLEALSRDFTAALRIPAGTPSSARIVCAVRPYTRSVGAVRKMIVWTLVREGENAAVAGTRAASSKEGGVLHAAYYTEPVAR